MGHRVFTTALLVLLPFGSVVSGSAEAEPPGMFVVTADSVNAIAGPTGRIIYLEGNVTIAQEGSTLRADRGRYHEDWRFAVLTENVRGDDGSTTITGDELTYDRDSNYGILIGNASLTDSLGTIRARRLEIYRNEQMAVATGDVVVTDRDTGSEVTAGRLAYDIERGEARATGHPLLTTFEEDGSVDLVMSGRVLEFFPDDDVVVALSDATISKEDMNTRSRIAVYFGGDERVMLTGEAKVEKGSDRLMGDVVEILTDEGEVSALAARGSSRADYTIAEDGVAEGDSEFGSVSGDTLTMHFDDGEATITLVRGSAKSEHHVGRTGERNDARSSKIDILFSDGGISRVTFRDDASGEYRFLSEAEADTEASAASGSETGDVESVKTPPGPGPGIDAGAGAAAAAPDTIATEVVRYSANQIDYYVPKNRIVLTGRAKVEHKGSVLMAQTVEFDPDREVLYAEGSPELVDRSDHLIGTALSYDMRERSGVVEEGATTFEDGLYYGDRILRLSEGTLDVSRGVYTTCSHAEPHYRLVSDHMKIYLDDKVIARPVILYIGEIPVFGLPFYVFPIRKKRHSGFLIPRIELGLSEGKGQFIRNFGYYWASSDYWDLSAWADYYEQTKWIIHGEARYKLRYVLSGSVDGSFMDELANNKRRWDLHVRHRQELGRHWTAGAHADFRSDAAYAGDTNQSIEESVNRSLHSQFWARGRWSSASLGVTFDRQEELDQGRITEQLPKADFQLSQRPIVSRKDDPTALQTFLGSISYNLNARAVNDRERSGSGTEVHQGIGFDASLRSSNKLLGWLNLTPKVNLKQDWFDRDKRGRSYPGRFTYNASVSTGTAVYGTFFPRLGPLEGIRHIVEPSAGFSWTPDFSQYFQDGTDVFYRVSGFSSTPRERKSLNLSLRNKLQLKLRHGAEVRKVDDFFRFTTSTSYNLKDVERPWGNITSNLDLRPRPGLSLRWNGSHDAYNLALLSSNLTATISLMGQIPPASRDSWEDRVATDRHSPVDEMRREIRALAERDIVGARPWDATLTFRYSRGATAENKNYWVDGRVALSLTANWRINYSAHYDLKENEVASQEYTIYRDLHCWEALFARRYYDGEWQHYFRIGVKSLPEIHAETGVKELERTVR